MIRVTIIYEATEGSVFDFDYYVGTHLQLTNERLANHGFLAWQVQRVKQTLRGAAGIVCITHLDFESLQHMRAGFDAHGEELQADFSNYTNIEPRMVLCEMFATSG